jgi:hypothetical protein
MRIRAKLAAAVALAVAGLMFMPGIASAHEEKHVGPYLLAVGFGTEPDAYAGYPNSVQLLLSKNDKPVVDLGDTLKVVVEFGDQSSDPMPLAPFFEIGEIGIPGDYRAFFVPSQPGDYTFHITGTIKGTTVDESFTSGPKTFASVLDVSSATFPQVQAPTNSDLATRIQTESDRTSSAITAATAAATSAQAAATSAKDAADSAKTVGIIAVIVGVIALIVGVVALFGSRKKA